MLNLGVSKSIISLSLPLWLISDAFLNTMLILNPVLDYSVMLYVNYVKSLRTRCVAMSYLFRILTTSSNLIFFVR